MTATHGPFARRDGAVDRARDHLLAGARLAAEQDGRVARADALDEVEHALRGGRAADEVAVARAAELLLEGVGAARQLIARVGADPRGAGEVREAAGGERSRSRPTARPCDRSTGSPIDLVAAAVDGRGDQRAAAGLGGDDLPVADDLVDEVAAGPGAASISPVPIAAATGAARAGPPTSTNARWAPSAVQRGIAGGARDGIAAGRGLRRAGDRRAARSRRGGGARGRRAPVSASSWRLPTSIVTWLEALVTRDAVDRQVRELGRAEHDLVAGLERGAR